MRGPNIRRRPFEYNKELKYVRSFEQLNAIMQGSGHGDRDHASENGSPEKKFINISEEEENMREILKKLRIK